MSTLDTDLFLALNAGANPNPYIALFAIAVTRFAILLVPCYIVVLWIQDSRRRRLLAFALVLALVIAIVLSFLTGLVIFRPRPFMAGLGNSLVEHRPSASFPSNHTLVFAVCATVLALVRQYGTACLATVIGLVVAWSRVYVGVHYPSDLLGGIILAVPAAMISLAVTARYGTAVITIAESLQYRLTSSLPKFGRR
ncbi:undecaprenyl-diphosphatase [uncultured Bosea sp.]|uniref:undecaprenyl-diphosphatase n=1 Tax=uncultured Bosea sp. TaxID=211457 RepID=UPI002600A6B7|nr:undecaprenyl-diphosphatase [uncultured Bosea sp.]